MFGLQRIKSYLAKNLDQIAQDPVLIRYGFSLSLIHIFTFLYWFFHTKVYLYIATPDVAICQPFFTFCRAFRVFSPETWRWFLLVYLCLGIFGSYLWFTKKFRWAYYYSFFILAVKYLIYIQDYRMMGNYHYIHYLFISLFLVAPLKRFLIPLTVVLVYVAAGILKLNYEWLSGAALYGNIGILEYIPLEWATAYVVVLELCFSWLLLAKNIKLRYFALCQFLIFHLYSVQIVGLFYPLVMFSVLSIFVLSDLSKAAPLMSFEYFKNRFVAGFISIFVLLQAYPLMLPGNNAITGEGRILALNMFDAQAVCRHSFYQQGHSDSIERNFDLRSLGPRIKCDPHLYLELAKNICREIQENSSPTQLHFHLQSKLSSESQFREVARIDDICSDMPRFNMLISNSWVKK